MNLGYEEYINPDSNIKVKDDNNFEVGSFDVNTFSINNTIGSGKKEEENDNSNKFSKHGGVSQQKQKTIEIPEQTLEKNKINNIDFIDKQKENGKEIEKEKEKEKEKVKEMVKEKEDNPFLQKSILSARRGSKNMIATRPIISRISDLNIDFQKIRQNNLTKEDIDYYEKEISELKAENEKLKKQGDDDFQKKVDEINDLKEQYKKDLDRIRINTENKIKELTDREKLKRNDLEQYQKYIDEQIRKEEDNINKNK